MNPSLLINHRGQSISQEKQLDRESISVSAESLSDPQTHRLICVGLWLLFCLLLLSHFEIVFLLFPHIHTHCMENKDFAEVGIELLFFSGQRIGPPTEPGFSQGFFSILSPMEFGSLPLSPLACLVGDTSFLAISSTWLHRYYLNWTELNDDITEFNNEMLLTENWVLNLVKHYWHTIFLFWYWKVALTQSVFLKALYK